MKKFLFTVIVIGGSVWMYFWYVRGVNLLIKASPSPLPAYSAKAGAVQDANGLLTRWQVAAPMPTPRTGVSAAAAGGKIYVVGGIDSFGQTVATAEVFDTSNNEWTAIAPLPKAVHHATVGSDGTKIYVFGGQVGIATTPVDTLYIYDPKTGSWSTGRDLPSPLGASAVAYFRERLHLVGGLGLGNSTQSQQIYDPKMNSWETGESIASGRDHLMMVAIEPKLYVVGGRAASLVYNLSDLEILDASGRNWEQGTNMPVRRSAAGAAAIGSTIYVFGGQAPSVTYGDVYAYATKTDGWKLVDVMPTPRHSFAYAEVGGRIYVIGGSRRPGLSVSDVVEVFTP